MHPDPHYRVGSSEKKACHRGTPKAGKRPAGYYGLPFRHDNDRRRPRTTAEIYELNRALAKKMEHVFVRRGIPVVPSIGPNSITAEFTSIWRAFVPFPSYQVFQRGGYFSVEVIPDAVAVISLNTMYFYDSNTAVGGCARTLPQDPGNLQLDWLEVQLQLFRERGIQVWLSGHVPPSSYNFYSECVSLLYMTTANCKRVRDADVRLPTGTSMVRQFFLLDAQQLGNSTIQRRDKLYEADLKGQDEDEALPPTVLKHPKKQLYKLLLQEFSDLPRAQNLNHDNYAVVNVAPSVIPTYLPSFRIFAYNATGEAYRPGLLGSGDGRRGTSSLLKALSGGLCDEEEYANSWRCHLGQPWHSSPESPSRTNRLWTPLGYAQYTLRKMNRADESRPPKFKLEYLTFPVHALHPPAPETDEAEGEAGTGYATNSTGSTSIDAAKARKFWYPIPKRHLPRTLRNSTIVKSRKFAPYGLEDLTIPSWTGLAQRLGRSKSKRLRQKFREFMYMGAGGA
ncbi:hypothetical protein BN946_scf184470.g38 [Trametes cinnabarina]|uniref:Uncharacterized protein n=1 Tax=Pycnoporus cinnabarinus TaxID=5643 RepID=A0A060SPI6_PYCCI|nr:hypothetical protein BN946_scf184470.g38 [Trametes cinnabarina]